MFKTLIFSLVSSLGIFLQSMTGFGGALFAIPLLTLFLSPKEAVPAVNLITFVVSLFLVYETRRSIQWKRIVYLLIGGIAGIPIGSYFLSHVPLSSISVAIYIFTFCFAVLSLFRIKLSIREKKIIQICVGFLSGFLGGSMATPGPPVILYGISCGWGKDTFRSTLLTFFFFISLYANISYLFFGLFSLELVLMVLPAVIPAGLGVFLGILLKNRINEDLFSRIVLIVIICVSILGIVQKATAF